MRYETQDMRYESSPPKRGDKGGYSPLEGSAEAKRRRGVFLRTHPLISSLSRQKQRDMEGKLENPFLRGDRSRSVQRSDQGCVNRTSRQVDYQLKLSSHTEHTPRSANRASRFRLHFSPSKGDLLITIAFVIAIFMGFFTISLHAQGSELFSNQLNTPLLEETSYPQLEEYLQIAIQQNPELQSLRYLVDAEIEKAREFSVLPDPELKINYDFNPMMSESQLGRFSISAMQMFPWLGTLDAQKDAQNHIAEARRASLDGYQLKLLRDIQITWFSIAEVEQQIRIAEQTLNLVGDLEQLVEIRYETARTGQADILRIQMEKERIQNRIENLEDKLQPLTSSFNTLLNRNPGEEVITAEPRRQPELRLTQDQITSVAISENPEFETLSFRKSALEQQKRAAELRGRPSFGIGLEVMGRDFGPMSMNPDATESFIGMATIRLPIYRTRTRSQKQQITNRIQSIEMDQIQTENRLSSDLEEVLESFRSSNRTIILLDEELIPRARQVLDILTEEYTAGNTRFDELLQIQRELLDLEFERIEAVVSQNKALARIEELIGGRSDEL